MSGYNYFYLETPFHSGRPFYPACNCCPMLPKEVALYPEEELVSLSTLYDLLDEQQHYFRELLGQQERSYRAFLQMLMDASSGRVDNLLREMQDLRTCLQRTKSELAEMKKQGVQLGRRAECLAEGLVMVRGALEGLSIKGRSEGAPQPRRAGGGGGLRLDGGARGGAGRVGAVKKAEPKAVKLVADLTDICFDNIQVVTSCDSLVGDV